LRMHLKKGDLAVDRGTKIVQRLELKKPSKHKCEGRL
jgi:hypothetical protein